MDKIRAGKHRVAQPVGLPGLPKTPQTEAFSHETLPGQKALLQPTTATCRPNLNLAEQVQKEVILGNIPAGLDKQPVGRGWEKQ